MSNFDRISVANLIKEAPHFIIPSYQRGYRWERKQVTDLLNDLRQFVTDGNSKNSCYYLQPIVIKKASWKNADGNNIDGWEVLDGQQRLTTMYLLLQYIIENELKRSEQKYFDEHLMLFALSLISKTLSVRTISIATTSLKQKRQSKNGLGH